MIGTFLRGADEDCVAVDVSTMTYIHNWQKVLRTRSSFIFSTFPHLTFCHLPSEKIKHNIKDISNYAQLLKGAFYSSFCQSNPFKMFFLF